MTDCKHPNATATGEVRPISSNCKKRKAKAAVPRPVMLCEDCGLHFVRMADGKIKVVPPSLPFKQALQFVHAGHFTGEAAAAQFGNYTDDERAKLAEASACGHDFEPILLVYRCADCGKLKQERVKVGAPPE